MLIACRTSRARSSLPTGSDEAVLLAKPGTANNAVAANAEANGVPNFIGVFTPFPFTQLDAIRRMQVATGLQLYSTTWKPSAHQAIDIRQDFRNGAIEIGGDFLADVDRFV